MSRRNKNKEVTVNDAFSNALFHLGYGSQSPLEATSYPLTRMTDNYAINDFERLFVPKSWA